MENLALMAVSLLIYFLAFDRVSASPHKYNAMFNFGDSLSDTGNQLIHNKGLFTGNLPNGMTFGKPTGRCSDGRLMIDFIAEELKLPLLPPYLEVAEVPSTRTGVNFAVAGATALDVNFLMEKSKPLNLTIYAKESLSVQLSWFMKWKSSVCTNRTECQKYFKKSLFIVGIGGNDYNYPYGAGASQKQERALVPFVVDKITNVTNELIEAGAVDLLVAGLMPPSCFVSRKKAPHAITEYHNKELQRSLQTLRNRYPHTRITYADYYSAAMVFYHDPNRFGFNRGTERACCGGGGPYNFNPSALCGQPGAAACKNPSEYVCWDGVHLTEAAYRIMARGLLHGPFTSSALGHFGPFF